MANEYLKDDMRKLRQGLGELYDSTIGFGRYVAENPGQVAEVGTKAASYALPGSSLAEIVGQAPEIVGEGQAPGIVDLLKEGKYGEAGALAAFLGLDIQQLAAITTVIPSTLIKASRGAGRGLDEMLDAYQTSIESGGPPIGGGGGKSLKEQAKELQSQIGSETDPDRKKELISRIKEINAEIKARKSDLPDPKDAPTPRDASTGKTVETYTSSAAGSSYDRGEVFGEGIGSIMYSTPATRAFANMKRPSQNISGEDLIKRLKLSGMDQSQSGIVSLIEEVSPAGLNDPNFIGSGETATISFDVFFQRLKDKAPRRTVTRLDNAPYSGAQQLGWQRTRSADNEMAVQPIEGPASMKGDSRFVNVHTNKFDFEEGLTGQELSRMQAQNQDHYKAYGEDPLINSPVIAHSRGGVYSVTDSANPDDVGHISIVLDEQQIDANKKVSQIRSGGMTPETRARETGLVKEAIATIGGQMADTTTAILEQAAKKETAGARLINETHRRTLGFKPHVVELYDQLPDALRNSQEAKDYYARMYRNFPDRSYDPTDPTFLASFLTLQDGKNLVSDLMSDEMSVFYDVLTGPARPTTMGGMGSSQNSAFVVDDLANHAQKALNGDTYAKRVIQDLADSIADQSTIGGILPRETREQFNLLKGEFTQKAVEFNTLQNTDRASGRIATRESREFVERIRPDYEELSEVQKKVQSLEDEFKTASKELADSSPLVDVVNNMVGRADSREGRRLIAQIERDLVQGEGEVTMPSAIDVELLLPRLQGLAKSQDSRVFDNDLANLTEEFAAGARDSSDDTSNQLAKILTADFSDPDSLGLINPKVPEYQAPTRQYGPLYKPEQVQKTLTRYQSLQQNLRQLFPEWRVLSEHQSAEHLIPKKKAYETSLIELKAARETFKKKHPDMTDDLLKEYEEARRGDGYVDLPFSDLTDAVSQVIQGDIAALMDGQFFRHINSDAPFLNAEELLEPGPNSIPKFISIPSGFKSLQVRQGSATTIDNPRGFRYADPGRDKAIRALLEDNPGKFTVREDLTNIPTTQTVPDEVKLPKSRNPDEMERLEKKKAGSSFDVIEPRDVVIELTPEYRRKLAERFLKAHNENLLDRTGQPDPRIGQYDKTDRFEALKDNLADGATSEDDIFVRFAKGGLVTKGIGSMGKEVL